MATTVVNTDKVNGGDMILLANTGTDAVPVWKMVLCNINLSLQRQLNTTDDSSKCGKDVTPTTEDGSCQFEGFILKAGLTDIYGMTELHSLVSQKQVIKWRIAPKNGVTQTNLPIYDFPGFISSIQDQYNNNEKAKTTFTITASDNTVFTVGV